MGVVRLRLRCPAGRAAVRARTQTGRVKTLRVKVKPNARAASLAQASDGTWVATLQSPPVDGKANEELIALVARHFGCRKAQVTIKRGAAARIKWIVVEDG